MGKKLLQIYDFWCVALIFNTKLGRRLEVLLLVLLKLCLYCFLGKSTLVSLVIVSILIQSLVHVRYHISAVTPDTPVNIIESLLSVMLLII
jgi:hypothetical protein